MKVTSKFMKLTTLFLLLITNIFQIIAEEEDVIQPTKTEKYGEIERKEEKTTNSMLFNDRGKLKKQEFGEQESSEEEAVENKNFEEHKRSSSYDESEKLSDKDKRIHMELQNSFLSKLNDQLKEKIAVLIEDENVQIDESLFDHFSEEERQEMQNAVLEALSPLVGQMPDEVYHTMPVHDTFAIASSAIYNYSTEPSKNDKSKNDEL